MDCVFLVTSANISLGIFTKYSDAVDSIILSYSSKPDSLTYCLSDGYGFAEYLDEDTKEYVRVERMNLYNKVNHL